MNGADVAKYDEEEIIECVDAKAWERWLKEHTHASGVWLKIAKKGVDARTVSISDALDVALCYGWIDSQRRGHDSSYYLQRYSPRRRGSPWSRLNVQRAIALVAAGRMAAAGLQEIELAKEDGRWSVAYEPQRTFEVPADFLAALVQSPQANVAFERLDKSGQYGVILPVLKATTPEKRVDLILKAIAKLETTDQESRAGQCKP